MSDKKTIDLADTFPISDESPSEEHTVTITAEPIVTLTIGVDEEAKALDIAERYEEHEKRIGGK